MVTVLLVLLGWLLLAIPVALIVGRSIRLADRRAATTRGGVR